MSRKRFKGKVIYEPNGAAYEYCHWACNLFNGCTNRCDYCYNRHSMTSAVLGADAVSLKKSLINEDNAFSVFCKELEKAKPLMLPNDSLFFSFVSDPMLPQNRYLTIRCAKHAMDNGVKVQILTKCSDWVGDYDEFLQEYKGSIAIGFTLTGMEKMESYCINNTAERIGAMRKLQQLGILTFASIEPVVGIDQAVNAVRKAYPVCSFFKVGLVSKMGIKFTEEQVMDLVSRVQFIVRDGTPVYWKQSVREVVGNEYVDAWDNSVPSNYDIFQGSRT